MNVISDIQTWPEAVVDIGPIELTENHWVIVGSIPYDGHVILAVLDNSQFGEHGANDDVVRKGEHWRSIVGDP